MPFDYYENNSQEENSYAGASKMNGLNVEGLGLKKKPKQRKPRRDPIAQSALAKRAEDRGQLGAGMIQPSPIQIAMGSPLAQPKAKGRNGNAR